MRSKSIENGRCRNGEGKRKYDIVCKGRRDRSRNRIFLSETTVGEPFVNPFPLNCPPTPVDGMFLCVILKLEVMAATATHIIRVKYILQWYIYIHIYVCMYINTYIILIINQYYISINIHDNINNINNNNN